MSIPTVIVNQSNRIAVRTPSGDELMYSYKTLVAVRLNDGRSYRTSKLWSRTTSKHIRQFGMSGAEQIPQEDMEKLVK